MLKTLGIAATCGIVLYGLVRLTRRHVVMVLDRTGTFPFGTPATAVADWGHFNAGQARVEDVVAEVPSEEVTTRGSSATGSEPSTLLPDAPARGLPCQ